ncbi:MAG: small multi-drug export protein [Candidatus Thermoplasmatota archaeon]|nr:small multi-drug export protein [Candidatus Thermoplasmatota archaeon]
MSTIADGLGDAIRSLGLPWWGNWISIILIAMLPVIELRLALPIAIGLDLDWGTAMLLSLFGNMVPVPFLMLFFGRVEKYLRRWKIFRVFFDRLFGSTRRKGERKLQVWGEIGLILFVAVPFPVTGAWTGTLAAYLLKLDRKRAFLSIFVGVVIAGLIMTVVSYVHWIWGIVILAGLAIVLIGIWKLESLVIHRNTSG